MSLSDTLRPVLGHPFPVALTLPRVSFAVLSFSASSLHAGVCPGTSPRACALHHHALTLGDLLHSHGFNTTIFNDCQTRPCSTYLYPRLPLGAY